jgi:hypothetical protein
MYINLNISWSFKYNNEPCLETILNMEHLHSFEIKAQGWMLNTLTYTY